ncbi:hypothetical protein ACTFIU_005304 [Dictyostelium citrinum]
MDIDDSLNQNTLDGKFYLILKNISSTNRQERYEAVQNVRKILSVEHNPPIDRVISSGLVPILHKYLVDETDTAIQYEASWALTNVASGSSEHTNYIVENEIHKSIIDLLATSNNIEFLEQNIWALGNIIGDSSQHRDSILNEGIVLHLVEILKTQTKKSLVSNISWTISNLCRGTPRPAFRFIKPLLPSIKSLLLTWNKEVEILSDTLWALSFLTESTSEEKEIFKNILSMGLAEIIIEIIFKSDSNNCIIPGFRTIGNMLSGPDDVTEYLLQCDVLKVFPKFLSSPKASLVKEGYWCLSNITSGPTNQIQRVIDHGLVKIAIETGKKSSIGIDTRREITWAIINAITGASNQQLLYLIRNGCLDCLKKNYGTAQAQANLFHYYLDGITNLLKLFIKQTKETNSLKLFNTHIDREFFDQLLDDINSSPAEFVEDYQRIALAFNQLEQLVEQIVVAKTSKGEDVSETFSDNSFDSTPSKYNLKISEEFGCYEDEDDLVDYEEVEESGEEASDYEEDIAKLNEMDLNDD